MRSLRDFRGPGVLAAAGLAALLLVGPVPVGPARAGTNNLGFVADFAAPTIDAATADLSPADSLHSSGVASVEKAAALPESSIWMMVLLWFAGLALAVGWRARKPAVSVVE